MTDCPRCEGGKIIFDLGGDAACFACGWIPPGSPTPNDMIFDLVASHHDYKLPRINVYTNMRKGFRDYS